MAIPIKTRELVRDIKTLDGRGSLADATRGADAKTKEDPT
jgi:hypothetical protein